MSERIYSHDEVMERDREARDTADRINALRVKLEKLASRSLDSWMALVLDMGRHFVFALLMWRARR